MTMDRAGQSIIQSTLFKITGSIFIFLIIIIFLYGKNYWEKEDLKINYHLVLTASNLKKEIDPHVTEIENLKADPQLTDQEKKAKIENVIKPLLEDRDDMIGSGYFDLALKFSVTNMKTAAEKIQTSLGKANEFYRYTWNKQNNSTFTVSYPIYNGDRLIGYAWAYDNTTANLFRSTYGISVIAILAFSIALMIIALVRKYIKQIELSLDQFTRMIVENPYETSNHVRNQLPELNPVLDKIAHFIDELKQANKKLEISQLKINQIMEGISDGFFALDRAFRFTYINQETQKLIGQEASHLLGKEMLEVFPQLLGTLTYEKLRYALSKKEAIRWETEGILSKERWYEYNAYPFEEGLTVFFRDVTEMKHRQKELARLERLNLIGQLAAGISHEIRNPLTTVKGFLQFLGTKAQGQDEEYMNLMISEIDRANGIITDFLSLAKVNSDNIKPQSLNEIILKVFPMLKADAYNQNKEVVLDLRELPDLVLNENEIKQLILNLVRNGLEASPESGKVRIRTYFEGGQAILEIIDQGPGIPEEIREKIGTPFFTTKESGTGLGLAISIGIVQRHNASLDFETGDMGTTFRITFKINQKNE